MRGALLVVLLGSMACNQMKDAVEGKVSALKGPDVWFNKANAPQDAGPAAPAVDAGVNGNNAGNPFGHQGDAAAVITDPGGEIAFMDMDGGLHVAPGHEVEALGICIQTVLKDREAFKARLGTLDGGMK